MRAGEFFVDSTLCKESFFSVLSYRWPPREVSFLIFTSHFPKCIVFLESLGHEGRYSFFKYAIVAVNHKGDKGVGLEITN